MLSLILLAFLTTGAAPPPIALNPAASALPSFNVAHSIGQAGSTPPSFDVADSASLFLNAASAEQLISGPSAAPLAPASLNVGADAPESLNASAIVEKAKALQKSRRPASETEDWNISGYGLTGHEHIARRGDDMIEMQTFGPFTSQAGKLGGKSWHQNENGYTVVTGDKPAGSVQSPVVSMTAVHVRSPFDAFEVITKRRNGVTERTYYAASDYIILREEFEFRGKVSRVDYSDFRPSHAYGRRAWHYAGGDGQPGNTFEGTLQNVAENAPVTDAMLAIPPNSRTLVEFPAGVDSVKIPGDVDGHIYADVIINGRQVSFIIDSGASDIVINQDAAKELGLQSYGKATTSVAGAFQTSLVVAPMVQVGDLTMRNVIMRTGPVDFHENGRLIIGLLGYDFIAGTALRVDYQHHSIEATRPSVFVPPLLATAQTSIRLDQQVPVVTVGVGNAQSTDMIIDTGADAPVLFFDRFVEAHPEAMKDEGLGGGYNPDEAVVGGVGGLVHIVPLRLSSFRFAGLEFKNFVVLRADQAGAFGDLNNDGLLGALFLRYFTVYLDYTNQRIFFEPNSNYTDALNNN